MSPQKYKPMVMRKRLIEKYLVTFQLDNKYIQKVLAKTLWTMQYFQKMVQIVTILLTQIDQVLFQTNTGSRKERPKEDQVLIMKFQIMERLVILQVLNQSML